MDFISGMLVGFVGLTVGVVVFLLIAPFLKGGLMNDPDDPDCFALFTEVEPGRAKIVMRGGHVSRVIRGSDGIEKKWSSNPLIKLYQRYVYWLIGLHVIGVPLIHKIKTYGLPRYKVVEKSGKKEYEVVQKGAPGYNTDHVRNELTTWYFQFSGAEVDTVPMTVKGSVQLRILSGREQDALFKTDSWNVLLDQALNSIIRGVMRADLGLDDIIGRVTEGVWKDNEKASHNAYEEVQTKLWEGLQEYRIETTSGQRLTLEELVGLEIAKVDILDFSPDLNQEELSRLYVAALEKQKARGRVIEGEAEAEFQKKTLEVLAKYPELAKINVDAEAFVKAAKAGQLDALLAGILKKVLK